MTNNIYYSTKRYKITIVLLFVYKKIKPSLKARALNVFLLLNCVNANSLAQGARTMMLTALGIANSPLFNSEDAKKFFELCGEA